MMEGGHEKYSGKEHHVFLEGIFNLQEGVMHNAWLVKKDRLTAPKGAFCL